MLSARLAQRGLGASLVAQVRAPMAVTCAQRVAPYSTPASNPPAAAPAAEVATVPDEPQNWGVQPVISYVRPAPPLAWPDLE